MNIGLALGFMLLGHFAKAKTEYEATGGYISTYLFQMFSMDEVTRLRHL